ncbi:hypothetical protein C4K39_2081 [Pseudomonas sessilinigenes]|nr:hypothetical protein C4K39_2081 [Pseudomonas sessilinigenes]
MPGGNACSDHLKSFCEYPVGSMQQSWKSLLQGALYYLKIGSEPLLRFPWFAPA